MGKPDASRFHDASGVFRGLVFRRRAACKMKLAQPGSGHGLQKVQANYSTVVMLLPSAKAADMLTGNLEDDLLIAQRSSLSSSMCKKV